MVCHARRSSKSRRHRPHLPRPAPLPPLAVLDLSRPDERQAHDFLCRATSKHDRMWTLVALHRQRDVLLCIVRWTHPEDAATAFALAEVSLTEAAVCWRDQPSVEAARAEMERRCATAAAREEPA